MTQACKQCEQEFDISDSDLEFSKRFDFKIANQTFAIPASVLCFACSSQRQMSFANQRNLYHRDCDGSGKKIISNYSADQTCPVYDVSFWFSDNWDQYASGRDFDFSRPFFDQFADLLQVAPRPNLLRSPEFDENADYTNYAGKNKNCYLIFDSDKNRDCYYSYSINSCENIIDCYRADECELCYESIDIAKCYGSAFLQNCVNCIDSWFLRNCVSCKNCFGCVNLRNKQYCFFNEQYSKEEYEKKVQEYQLNTFRGLQAFKDQWPQFLLQFPNKAVEGVNNENVYGNYLTNCKDAIVCFDSRNLWDCRYITQAFDSAKDSMYCTKVGDGVELLYNCAHVGYNANNVMFTSHALGQTSNLLYSYFVPYCLDSFGCVGLRRAQYCILNKQYSKEEYEALLPRIIEHMKSTGEWGEFFPTTISPFAYNESMAYDHLPLTKEEVLARGWKWKENTDLIEDNYLGPEHEIPDDIYQVDEAISKQILQCELTDKAYKIIPQELEFYKKMSLPIPRQCPDQRHKNRMKLRNARQIFNRHCDKCTKAIQTTYSPERPEVVYCEQCYLDAVY